MRHRQINIQALATEMSMRKRDRTSDEELVAIGRHEAACNAEPEKLESAERVGEELEDECVEMAHQDEF